MYDLSMAKNRDWDKEDDDLIANISFYFIWNIKKLYRRCGAVSISDDRQQRIVGICVHLLFVLPCKTDAFRQINLSWRIICCEKPPFKPILFRHGLGDTPKDPVSKWFIDKYLLLEINLQHFEKAKEFVQAGFLRAEPLGRGQRRWVQGRKPAAFGLWAGVLPCLVSGN